MVGFYVFLRRLSPLFGDDASLRYHQSRRILAA
jgi:hypothetical protein